MGCCVGIPVSKYHPYTVCVCWRKQYDGVWPTYNTEPHRNSCESYRDAVHSYVTLHARRESSLSAIENNGLTKREREWGVSPAFRNSSTFKTAQTMALSWIGNAWVQG